MLAWKFSFGYVFLVQPLCTPTIALYDDYMNFPGTSYYLSMVLVLLRWFPAMLVFAIDTSIWYALWSGVVGVYIGLDEGLGVVKNFREIREQFMNLPEAFCGRIISAKALPSVTNRTEADSKVEIRRARLWAAEAMARRSSSATRVRWVAAWPKRFPTSSRRRRSRLLPTATYRAAADSQRP